MTKARQIYVVGGHRTYSSWMEGTCTNDMKFADLVCFTGGEDIGPSLYGHDPHPRTSFNPARDTEELAEFRKAMDLKKPLIGICRGAQFLCAMAGGKLVQHQPNPSFIHRMNTFNEKSIHVSSAHHQAQFPWDLAEDDYRILGWTVNMLGFHEGEGQKEMVIGRVPNNIEVEDCHYPHIRALCIQSHPEILYNRPSMDDLAFETIEYYRGLLDLHLTAFPNAK